MLPGSSPFSASIVWYSSEKMIFRSSFAPACFVLAAEIAMLEPPAKTGATPPSTPGRANTPHLSSFHSTPSVPSSRVTGSPIDQYAQLGASAVAASGVPVSVASLSFRYVSASVSVVDAVEAFWNRSWNCSSPVIVFASENVDVQVLPS